jgi:excisionase family DNA binding protein
LSKQEITTENLSFQTLAKYVSVSEGTLKSWEKCGMPVIRVGRIVRVKRSDFDAWLAQFRRGPEAKLDLNTVLDQVMEEVRDELS